MTADAPRPPAPEISLVEAVWRYRLMSLLIVLACGLASVAATQLLFGSVTAKASFAISDPTNKSSLALGVVSAQGFSTYTAQRAAFAESGPVLRRAADLLAARGGPRRSLEQMRASVSTSAKPEGGVVMVTASGRSMSVAAGTANAVIQSYQDLTSAAIKSKRDLQLKNLRASEKKIANDLLAATGRQATNLATNLQKLQNQETALLTEAANDSDGVQFVDAADPGASTPSKLPRNLVIGLAAGMLLACVASFLRASSPGESSGGTRRRKPAAQAPEPPAAASPWPGSAGTAATGAEEQPTGSERKAQRRQRGKSRGDAAPSAPQESPAASTERPGSAWPAPIPYTETHTYTESQTPATETYAEAEPKRWRDNGIAPLADVVDPLSGKLGRSSSRPNGKPDTDKPAKEASGSEETRPNPQVNGDFSGLMRYHDSDR